MKFKILISVILFWQSAQVFARPDPGKTDHLPLHPLPLQDLSAFQPTTANWQIVGNAYADRHTPQALEGMPGKGILANISDAKNRGHLFTKMEHGDIELELDVMMARESNSGIYLQGRYELQLQDSWGRRDKLRYMDIGGIYQRTDTVTNKGYEGSAPAVNASKAPGLWQHLRVVFQAPRYNSQGTKTANARFLKVYLNGSLVQDNVEVSGPTRSAGFKDEKPLGPIMIQGNHGRVAFKNIAYKLYDGATLKITELVLREFRSPGDSLRNYSAQTPLSVHKTDSISYLSSVQKDIYLLEYQGKIHFPKAGKYLFKLQTGGGGLLIIDKDTVVLNDGVHGFGEEATGIYLAPPEGAAPGGASPGGVPFNLVHNRLIQWRKGLALYVEGPEMALQPLHAKGSVFHEPLVEPITIEPEPEKAFIQRSFMPDGDHKRTHCLSVGTSGGANFTVDLESGSLFQMWDGGFLETTPMWHRRGNEQIAIPLGTVITLGDALNLGKPLFLEYNIDKKGLPTFSYLVNGIPFSDKLTPSTTERSLTRKIVLNSKTDYSFTLATGAIIEQLPDGSYAMHDKNYYLTLDTPGLKPVLRKSGDQQELVIAFKGAGIHEIQYTLLW